MTRFESPRRWALILLVLFIAGGVLWWPERQPPLATNAILITVDTLRPDRMSLHGYDRSTTPNLLRYFGDSAFHNARSTAPCTLPAVKQFLTGRLDMGGVTMAQTLQEEGFHTAAVVSQHWFSSDPVYRSGFDYWDVQGEQERDGYGLSTRKGDAVTSGALRWLDTKRGGGDRFFLWVHYFDPHDPYSPPDNDRHFSLGVDRYVDGDRRAAQHSSWDKQAEWFLVDSIFDDADRDALSRLYDDEVRFVDQQIGLLLSSLDNRGLLDDAIVVFGADHGERLGEEGVWDHCYSLHDLELRVPLALRLPSLPGPLDLETVVSTLDFYPTLLDALDILEPRQLDGQSLLAPRTREATLSSFDSRVAVTDENWKLYLNCTQSGCEPETLVRLGPGTGLDGNPVLLANAPDEVKRLAAEVSALEKQLANAFEIVEREFEALRSIGYIQ